MTRTFTTVAMTILALIGSARTADATFMQLWQVGDNNETTTEFVIENGSSNSPPGSAVATDDDWYFAGTYPAPIGVLGADEPLNQFERALTNGDPTDRIHFNLDASEVGPTLGAERNKFFIEADIIFSDFTGGTGSGVIPFRILFNGNVVLPTINLASNGLLVTSVFDSQAASAVLGENVITLERDAGANWIQFDFVSLYVEQAVPEPSTGLLAALAAIFPIMRVRRRRERSETRGCA